MNIYKRAGEGLYFSSFTQEECEKIIDILQCAESLAFGDKSEMNRYKEITVYTFSSEKVQVDITEENGDLKYSISIKNDGNPFVVFDAYVNCKASEFFDYSIWTFHDGWWVEELKKLTADDDELKERRDAFKPLSELAK